jgi:hypothetical protein
VYISLNGDKVKKVEIKIIKVLFLYISFAHREHAMRGPADGRPVG